MEFPNKIILYFICSMGVGNVRKADDRFEIKLFFEKLGCGQKSIHSNHQNEFYDLKSLMNDIFALKKSSEKKIEKILIIFCQI